MFIENRKRWLQTDNATAMIEAGSDTTSSALNLLILYLTAHPPVQRRAAEEVRQVVGEERSPKATDVPKLPFIRSSVKEIFRIAPLTKFGTMHFVTRDIFYKSYTIPRGNFVVINQNALHFDESYFPDPFTFNPEHFLKHSESAGYYANQADADLRDQYNFGAGRRICPGIHLAEASLQLTLAKILWAFEIRSPGDTMDGEAGFQITQEYFQDGANVVPRPFRAEFRCRSQRVNEVIDNEWQRAQAEGYSIRGEKVDLNGLVARRTDSTDK
jgi:cytochrome P450